MIYYWSSVVIEKISIYFRKHSEIAKTAGHEITSASDAQ